MTDQVFSYRAQGTRPETLTIDFRNGLLRLTMRGEPTTYFDENDNRQLREGATAQMVLPHGILPELIHRLLEVPMIAELIGAVPFVMYFESQAECDQFLAAVREIQPGLVEQSLDRASRNTRG